MRKLNYEIKIGTHFILPAMSWQVRKIKGEYEIKERIEDDDEVIFLCVGCDTRNFYVELLIPEMTLAYLLGEDVEGEVNGFVTYDRKVTKMDKSKVNAINREIINLLK